ncbi:MAG: HAD family hydrolase [Deltaproteobacteria bacterium]|nr:MAG: HAD family hydrolase [Deltaproteobacteria bacterium]
MTFDCWGTLIYERDSAATYARRVALLDQTAAKLGWGAAAEEARGALDEGWRRHWSLWHEGTASSSPEIAGWALAALAARRGRAAPDAEAVADLGSAFASAGLEAEIRALDGARETLERLAAAGVRRALICDTGFSPGSVVPRILESAGLLEHLEVTIFSDEAGVPKPDPRVFEAALEGLRLTGQADTTVHVGDLRRTDVAGGRCAGMRTVRIRSHYDDRSALPDADRIADSHDHLLALLGLA